MAKVRRVPQRQCVACRQMRPKRELVRVVRTPAGEVRVDPTGKVSGRGAYVCPAADCAEVALRAGRLEHALASPISDETALALRELAARTAAARAVETQNPRRPRHAGV
ncbi:MAG: YlxR family protein [Armatimonadota bacterium]|nr:YlxR family protein [Armatimonadota bacterium]MDR7421725.1 YlxR family protein [Armatimonadota bacterium]MDR7453722.1 YlxR family protein [Armatimonadota bacterium]MDR7456403.1 YlxR family protein [Armatimonadota bacterium]MDR7496699.1 YlxR family protein [Armatimonadota bacterium]